MLSICCLRIEVGRSMKRPGCAEPAMHQRMSGVWELFQVVASEIMRVASVGEVRSALI